MALLTAVGYPATAVGYPATAVSPPPPPPSPSVLPLSERGRCPHDVRHRWFFLQVQIAASMNPSGGIGRYPLVSRFTALLSVAYIAYPPKEQLSQVYCEYLGVLMSLPPLDKHHTWGGGKNADELSNTLVSVYDQVCHGVRACRGCLHVCMFTRTHASVRPCVCVRPTRLLSGCHCIRMCVRVRVLQHLCCSSVE